MPKKTKISGQERAEIIADGDRFSEYDFLGNQNAIMKFKMSLIPYIVDTSWIEPILFKVKECLDGPRCPDHGPQCEHGKFLEQASNVNYQ